METTQERWNTAVKQIRAQGVKIRQNVRQCCRGYISFEQLGMEQDSTVPYAFTFGGQGNNIVWRDGEPYHGEKIQRIRRRGFASPATVLAAREDRAYIYWGNGSAQIVKDVFEAQGFEVEWDGTDMTSVVVKFPRIEVEA